MFVVVICLIGGFGVAVYGLSLVVARIVGLVVVFDCEFCWVWLLWCLCPLGVGVASAGCFCLGWVYLVYIVDFVALHIVGCLVWLVVCLVVA